MNDRLLAAVDFGGVVGLLRLPYRQLVGRERYQVSIALIVLFIWAIIGTLLAAAFTRAAGKC